MYPIAANTWIWQSPLTDGDLEPLLEKIARMGFDAVELPLESVHDFSVDAARRALHQTGLRAVAVGVMPQDRNLVATDPATVRHTQQYLVEGLDIAAELGSTALCGPFYASVGRTWALTPDERSSVYGELCENLGPVVAHARSVGVQVGIETLNRYETSILNTVDQALEALGPLLGQGLGLALDTYHLGIEERSTAAAIERAGSHVVHVQVCGNDRGAPGGDQTDWTGVFSALQAIGYDGVLGIESFTAHNASIARAASIWRPLAPTQDDLARDGLAFLRQSLLTIDDATAS
jgi:D-psicose/D-tagatose/L-ribulose 3-epimerase